MFRIISFLVLTSVICSCSKTNNREDKETSLPKIELSSENLDEKLFAAKSVEDVQDILDQNPYLKTSYFTDFPGEPSKLAPHLFEVLQNQAFRSFGGQVDSIIGDRKTAILNPLADAFKHIQEKYPSFKVPAVKFIMTGFAGNDLLITDSLIVIGLDYFGGPAARFRPNVFDYQLRRYQKEYIVPSILFFMSGRFNKMNPGDKTLLAEIIGYGKSFEFVKQIDPSCPDSLITGFSADNLRKTYNSQKEIWGYFISNKLLYEKNDLKKQKYIGERPYTVEIGNEVPGGIGRWVGWRIVNVYVAKHPDVKLQQLMAMDNALNLFQESGYNGEKDEED